jgi:thiol-disulfide isomerase/thioredoxin
MLRSLFLSALAVLACSIRAAEAPASPADFEQKLAELVARPEVTVVHLWAPWCPNCRNEMKPEGWAAFVAAHPSTRIVFVNVWSAGQNPAPKLQAGGLGDQPNFIAWNHPNESRKAGERLERLLGFPITWVPSTWVFRAGKLRFALNYGEVRFNMLDQMVSDAAAKW